MGKGRPAAKGFKKESRGDAPSDDDEEVHAEVKEKVKVPARKLGAQNENVGALSCFL
jgi:hypothetical protein